MNYNVRMTRGTTYTISVSLYTEDRTPYILSGEEKLLLGVRAIGSKEYSVYKTVSANDGNFNGESYDFNFEPDDTIDLELSKDYYYDVSLQNGDQLYPVIPFSHFNIIPNVVHLEVSPNEQL